MPRVLTHLSSEPVVISDIPKLTVEGPAWDSFFLLSSQNFKNIHSIKSLCLIHISYTFQPELKAFVRFLRSGAQESGGIVFGSQPGKRRFQMRNCSQKV